MGTIAEPDAQGAQDACNTRDVVAYCYGVMPHMQNTYDSGARVCNVAPDPKKMKLWETDNSIAFLALENP